MGSYKALFDEVRTIAIADIAATYAPLGIPLSFPIRILHFINDTNGSYMLSTDGVTDMIPLVGSSFNLYDLTTNEDANEMLRERNGTQWYIRYLIQPTSSGTLTNAVYLSCMYGEGE